MSGLELVGVSAILLVFPSGYKLVATVFSISVSHYHIEKQEIWVEAKNRLFSWNDLSDQKNLSKNLPSGHFLMFHWSKFMSWTHHRLVTGITKELL